MSHGLGFDANWVWVHANMSILDELIWMRLWDVNKKSAVPNPRVQFQVMHRSR